MKTGRMVRTVFGPEFPGHGGTVFTDELEALGVVERAKAFKARMDRFFKEQVGMFAPPKLTADFPLVIMTCVGIETLGTYKYGDLGHPKAMVRGRVMKDRHFQRIVEDIDPDFKDKAAAPDPPDRPLSDFVYEGFRSSLVHGFYGKWVFIAGDDETKTWFYDPSEKSVVPNTCWFYREFCRIYEDYFMKLLACSDPTREPLRTFDQTFTMYFSRWL
jgi:hypothetical protein